MLDYQASPTECPHCGQTMRPGVVKTAIWYDEKLYVIEDVPAQVCDKCVEQFYDDATTDILRRLTEVGFPLVHAKGEILVPLFSLKGLQVPATEAEESVPE